MIRIRELKKIKGGEKSSQRHLNIVSTVKWIAIVAYFIIIGGNSVALFFLGATWQTQKSIPV
jgi:hypothetical protein